MERRRLLRIVLTLVVTGLCTAYLLWKVDVSETAKILRDAHPGYFLLALALVLVTVWPMAWRWQLLLRAKSIDERIGWLTRAYFVSYAAGQVLPTAVGGDAVRIYETARRHTGRTGLIAGSILLERAIGGVATLMLAAFGFLLAFGHYDVGAYLWIEGLFVVGTAVLAVLFFSRRIRGLLRLAVPALARIRLARPMRALYEGIHAYRENVAVLLIVLGVTILIQAVRILSIWLSGEAVGIDLSPRPYFVMGPLLFLVMLVPFTINGLAVRESFFVSFLGGLSVDSESAFAAGFLFFVVTLVLAAPGALILGWEALRDASGRPRVRHG